MITSQHGGILCLLNLHKWLWVKAPMAEPGLMRRGCLRCGKVEYHGDRK